MRLYQLYDRVALRVIGSIISEEHDGPVIRAFHSLLSDPKGGPGQYPLDYDIVCIGEQDVASGVVSAYGSAVVVATGRAWLESQENVRPLEVMEKVGGVS
ncbi:MAG: nonstructural protein [Microviridae sp.]|nr:MAG: nonstructural protein [Microviridae sp.]